MRILIADDHALFRDGLRLQLQALDESAQILDAADFDAALAQVGESNSFDLILIDLGMPGMDWRQALPLLRQRCPGSPIVVVSASDAHDNIFLALNSGAAGYIPKSCSGQVMLRALKLVLSGGIYVPPEILTRLEYAGTSARLGEAAASYALTRRQSEVLALMAEGQSNKQIAHILDLSEGTVKIHVAAVLKALNAKNRTRAVLVAARGGLLSGFEKTD